MWNRCLGNRSTTWKQLQGTEVEYQILRRDRQPRQRSCQVGHKLRSNFFGPEDNSSKALTTLISAQAKIGQRRSVILEPGKSRSSENSPESRSRLQKKVLRQYSKSFKASLNFKLRSRSWSTWSGNWRLQTGKWACLRLAEISWRATAKLDWSLRTPTEHDTR